MSQDTPSPSDYLFAQATDEVRRLKRQSEFFHRFTSAFLESAGITSGMKVLDVGTGIGDVAFMLAERVGPRGTVVGVDMDPAMIALARQRAQAAGFANVSFLQGDIGHLSLDDQFDAVVGRLVLMYMKDRVAVLRRLRQQLRPGGVLAFQELDLALAGTSLLPAPLFEQVGERLTQVFRRAGLDTQGLNLFPLFLEAGLPTPEMELITTVGGGPDWSGYEQLVDITKALLPLILTFGIATEEEIQAETLLQRLREEAAARQNVVMIHGLMNVRTRIA
ncbi:MAG TPA: class I SAM-dependent methyltransferase [Ktedonobacterales bacterium]|nr:class I SAM-dependent methyltransferase [Ktedonobacterales bacterium]